MLTSSFDYVLPRARIAQHPIEPRDAARLMLCQGEAIRHHRVRDLPDLLRPGDCLVLNRTRVIPARLAARKASGGKLEVLLIHAGPPPGPVAAGGTGLPVPADASASHSDDGSVAAAPTRPDRAPQGDLWTCMIKGSVAPGVRIRIEEVEAMVEECRADGLRLLRFAPGVDVLAVADRHGHVPLPPYIARADQAADRDRYQSVFADRPGSVAAPTASLHLTAPLLEQLAAHGIERTFVDLAIGPGTFKPVDCERVEDFAIHAERGSCPPEAVTAIDRCRQRGGRVIAVGTTSVRVVESAARQPAGWGPWEGWTTLFLHPPDRLRMIDGLMTNFHLPRSSLLMLVSCLTGVDRLHAAYASAIAADYRFFSYGDAMLILPPDAAPKGTGVPGP
jgi:S-adenosylmethionine:tRNA ribosyltransferase-isomerase